MTHDELCMVVMGRTDALFEPVRKLTKARQTVDQLRRAFFDEGGIPWRSLESDEAARRTEGRQLAEKADAGTLRLKGRGGAKLLTVRLSDDADEGLRCRVFECDTLADSGPLLLELARRHKGGRRALAEPELVGLDYGTKEQTDRRVWLQDALRPALWRGLVDSNATVRGHVCYWLTASGLRYAEALPEVGTGEDFRAWRDAQVQVVADELAGEDPRTVATPAERGPGGYGDRVMCGEKRTMVVFWLAGFV